MEPVYYGMVERPLSIAGEILPGQGVSRKQADFLNGFRRLKHPDDLNAPH